MEKCLDVVELSDIISIDVRSNTYCISVFGNKFGKLDDVDFTELKDVVNSDMVYVSDYKNKNLFYTQHGIRHHLRVQIYCYILGKKINLPLEDLKIMNFICAIHDTQRLNDYKDVDHGKAAYTKFVKNNHLFSEKHKKMMYDVLVFHDAKIEYTDNVYLMLLKCSDALDRFRLKNEKGWINFDRILRSNDKICNLVRSTTREYVMNFREFTIETEKMFINDKSLNSVDIIFNNLNILSHHSMNLSIELLNNIKQVLCFEAYALSNFLVQMFGTVSEEMGLRINYLQNKSDNMNKAYELSKNIDKIQIGCGKNLLKNFINIDINFPADVIWDVRDSLPFLSESVGLVFSEHTLEHLDFPSSAEFLLSEIYRVLKVNGEVIIGVPDCDFPMKDYLNGNCENMNLAISKWYNERLDVKTYMTNSMNYLNYVMRDQLYHKKYHPHYWGYNEENLTELMKKSGFCDIEKCIPSNDLTNEKRKWGSIYLKGYKK